MIAMLTGKLVLMDEAGAVVDVGGVGYRVLCPNGALAGMPRVGSKITLHTHLHVREDALTLYGFGTAQERALFETLIAVNGIGPKGALAVLSAYAPDAFRKAVLAEDLDALTLVPGVGRKTAARMILELRERLGGDETVIGSDLRPALAEAREALVALGYSTTEAREALEAVAEPNGHAPAAEDLLKRALKRLGAGR